MYVDTSVIGGCLDSEFAVYSKALLDAAGRGEIILIVSDVTTDELAKAPGNVRALLDDIPKAFLEFVNASTVSAALANAYMEAV